MKRIYLVMLFLTVLSGLCGCSAGVVGSYGADGVLLNDICLALFDKDGPGDHGIKVKLDDGQRQSLFNILQTDVWSELVDPPQAGISGFTFSNEDGGHQLFVGIWEEKTIIIVLTGDERLLYTAPQEIFLDVSSFTEPLKETALAQASEKIE